MFRTVVVPLDGSPLSEGALVPARTLATRLDVPITLVTTGWGDVTNDSAAYLTRIAEGLGRPGTTTVVVPDRFAAGAIADAVEAAAEPLTCMATHGRTGIGRALLGSTAEEVIRTTARPVLLVGPAAGLECGTDIEELVLTIDGSATSAGVVPLAVEWAKALGLRVSVVTIEETGKAVLEPVPSPGSSASSLDLDGVAAEIRQAGLEVSSERLQGSDVPAAIVSYAEQRAGALVVMATHGRSGLSRTALGSVAMRVVHHASCPVLVARPVAAS
jgi:nucleotide-binding universal stress UspA family protein